MQDRAETLSKAKADVSEKLAVMEAEYRTYKSMCDANSPVDLKEHLTSILSLEAEKARAGSKAETAAEQAVEYEELVARLRSQVADLQHRLATVEVIFDHPPMHKNHSLSFLSRVGVCTSHPLLHVASSQNELISPPPTPFFPTCCTIACEEETSQRAHRGPGKHQSLRQGSSQQGGERNSPRPLRSGLNFSSLQWRSVLVQDGQGLWATLIPGSAAHIHMPTMCI